ncbi:hypothetical protein [Nocardioides sp. WS12]|uniref:hypothetical protein n=1 Tax=Nocardioides sp. WS12 TaxID=2486272 RepID=UPI0015FD4540|nr:hypothetical protein [Nocardioides sp. WS12]
MRVRRLWPAAFLLLVPVLTGCSEDGGIDGSGFSTPTDTPSTPDVSETATTPTETTTAPAETTSAAPAGLPAACDVVTSDDVARAFGVSFGSGVAGGGSHGEGAFVWESDNCSFVATDLVQVTVAVSGPDDFTEGGFGCPQPSESSAILEPADDVAGATDGWWKVSDAPPLAATLRACSSTALVAVELEYEDGVDYEGDPRSQSIALAELVLAALQG